MILALVLILGGNVLSVPVMYLYSLQQESVWKSPVEVDFPSGCATIQKDWYPLVLTSSVPGIERIMGQECHMLVRYSFGAYEGLHSGFYDSSSNYFLSFYGCYIIELEEDDQALYRDGVWDEALLEKIPTYDLDVLVLGSLGCDREDSTYEIEERSYGHNLAGLEGWARFDAKVFTRSPDHEMERLYPAYLQYGLPPEKTQVDFPRVTLEGRMYARYFPGESVYVLFFILGKERDFLQQTEEQFIRPALIRLPNQR